MLDLCCCVGFSLMVASWGYSLVAVHGLLLLWTMGSRELWGSVVVTSPPSPRVCGLNSYGTRAWLHQRIIKFPQSRNNIK